MVGRNPEDDDLGLIMKKETKDTLIALLKDRRDLDLLLQYKWYRIPVKSAPQMVKSHTIKYLAFYQPGCFKVDAFKIRWYGAVRNICIMKRKDLLPAETTHPKAEEDYYRIDLEELLQLAEPVFSRRRRRMVFITTTFARFQNAREFNDVFNESPLEEKFWEGLKLSHIDAERQYMEQIRIEEKIQTVYLDFAVFGRERKIGIECDGDTYHTEKDDVKRDKRRSNALESQGWAVLRYTTDAINRNLENCIREVAQTINTHGGLQDTVNPSVSRYLEDGQDQLRLFD
ncbi:MAG: DUF559 domain-containing protein [Candidatus Competibacter sp.]|nr:DUF559 domain-containing protein [Candidatus Competibacter sp.]